MRGKRNHSKSKLWNISPDDIHIPKRAFVDGEVRVRFAPSPTGYLHLGGARTALYNWLLAKKYHGKLVLRIEDTNESRHNEDAVGQIIRSMDWMGMKADEGPYYQSARKDKYNEILAKLKDKEQVYPCFCTEEMLSADKEASRAAKRAHVYNGRCRKLDPAVAWERAKAEPHTIRFKMPTTGAMLLEDWVRGRVRQEYALLGDHVIRRSDGGYTYNFTNPIDDYLMKVTHIVRGEDLLPSTAKQVALLKAVDDTAVLPGYGHLPMILNENRKRLAKRDGAASVEDWQEAGIYPEALLHGLALLGWSHQNHRQLLKPDDLINEFDLSKVNSAGAVFDPAKMAWFNGQHIRSLPSEDFSTALEDYLMAVDEPRLKENPELVHASAALAQPKINSFSEWKDLTGFLFTRQSPDETAQEILNIDKARSKAVLDAGIKKLDNISTWDETTIQQTLRNLCDELEVKPRDGLPILQIGITGRKIAPSLFGSMQLLGKDETIERLEILAKQL